MAALDPSDVTEPAGAAFQSSLNGAIEAGRRAIQLCDAAGASLPACHFQLGVDVLLEMLEQHGGDSRSPLG